MNGLNKRTTLSWVIWMGALLSFMVTGCEPSNEGMTGDDAEFAVEQGDLTLASPTLNAASGAAGNANQATSAGTNAAIANTSSVLMTGLKLTTSASKVATKPIQIMPDQVSICCVKEGQLNQFMTPLACKIQGGTMGQVNDCKVQKEICCVPSKGVPITTTASNCEEVFQGTVVEDALCSEDPISLCCGLPDGMFELMTNIECAIEGGSQASLSMCESFNDDVCCVAKDGLPFMTSLNICNDNFGGTVVADEVCEEDPVSLCCGFADGTFALATNYDCAAQGGSQMPLSYCQAEEVCCESYTGTFVGTPAECEEVNGTIVSMELCEEPPVDLCCQFDTVATMTSAEKCEDNGGVIVADEFCEDTCCEVDGVPVEVNVLECELLGGTFLAPEECEETSVEVCCEVDGVGSIMTDTQCLSVGGNPMGVGLCEETCCEVDGVQMTATLIECELLGGTFLSPSDCDTDPIVVICCEVGSGAVSLPADLCAAQGGTPTAPEFCQLCDVDIDPSISLMITDPTILAAFPMDEVMDQLAVLGPGGSNGQTGTELFQQWWSSQRERQAGDPANHPFCDDNGSTINGFPIQCPRNESQLEAFDGSSHSPIAIVNRFDLAPTNGEHCGEYRLVYAKNSGVASGRNFIIFEGVLENPEPTCGLMGCHDVAEFWAGLALEADPAVRATLIHDFFYNGLPGYEPVVRPESYGLVPAGTPSGQIRTNQFMSFDWNLREFILTESCPGGNCEMLVQQTTVKGNPSPQLWDGTHPLSASYEADYVAQMALQQPAVEDINNLGMETFDIYNTGESDSQGTSGPSAAVYNPGSALATAIGNAIPGASFLTVGDIAARAQTMTCGGCHQTSSNDNLGTQFSAGLDLLWPAQVPSFVHIDENSILSTALTMPGGFLDRRAAILEDFLDTTCGEECLITPIIVLVDGSLVKQEELDAAFVLEEEEFADEVAIKCGPLGTEPSEEEEAAEEAQTQKSASKAGSEKVAGEKLQEENSGDEEEAEEELAPQPSAEECAAQMQKEFKSKVAASIKPTPTNPSETTLSGSTTH